MNRKASFIEAISIIALFFACSTDSTTQDSLNLEDCKKEPKSSIYKRSELSLFMREMHDEFKKIRYDVKADKVEKINLDFYLDSIYYASSTEGQSKEQIFKGFAKHFVSEVDSFKASSSVDTYNSAINSCIHCHNSYCPGPISKIKKLKITTN